VLAAALALVLVPGLAPGLAVAPALRLAAGLALSLVLAVVLRLASVLVLLAPAQSLVLAMAMAATSGPASRMK
jgi:hypothetical protein